MTSGGLLDRLALVACALIVALVLVWVVFNPIVAVFRQLAMVVIALAWRFGGNHEDVYS